MRCTVGWARSATRARVPLERRRVMALAAITVVVTGKTVLSLTCPQLPLAKMACGAGAVPLFRTLNPIPFGRSRVLVQYDRPAR